MEPLNPAHHASGTSSDAILQELAWLRRVASALLGRGEEAEDLVQEVVVEAMRQRETTQAFEKPRLRSWLRTVAQRKAWRSATHKHRRHDGETQRALLDAPAELTPDEALERLELHRELTHEIEQLDPADRELIVQRYLQGLAAKEIAMRSGVSPAVARKRLARALERLKSRLHATPRGDSWMEALAILALEVPSPTAHLVAASTSTLAALPWFVMKLTLVAGVIGLSLTVLWFHRSQDQGNAISKLPPVDVAAGLFNGALEEADPGERDSSLLPSRVLDRRSPSPSHAAPETPSSVRALLPDGAPAAGVSGAYVSAKGEVSVFVYDEEGRAPARPGFEGQVFASAPGHRTALLVLNEDIQGGYLRLSRASLLEGVFTVGGLPPNERIELRCFLSNQEVGLEAGQSAARDILDESGIVPERVNVTVAESGRFGLEMTWANPTGLDFTIPPAFLVTAVNGVPVTTDRTEISLPLGTDDFHVELERLPAVRGRLVWQDNREALQGEIVHQRINADGKTMDGIPFLRLDQDGRFVVPAVALPRGGATEAGPLASEIRIHIQSPPGAAGTLFRFPLSGLDLPLDLGDVEVERTPALPVRVRGMRADGTTIALQAVVVGPDDIAHTDPDGNGVVLCNPGEELEVLAPGWHYRQIVVPQGRFSQDAPFDIQLDPASRLVLTGCNELRTVFRSHEPLVRIAFDWTPFETAVLDDGDAGDPYSHRVHHAEGRARGGGVGSASWSFVDPGAPGYIDYRLPDGDRLEVAGLLDARPFSVQVMDALGQLLWSEEVTLSESRTIDLSQAVDKTASLSVQVLWMDETPVDSGQVQLSGNSDRSIELNLEQGVSKFSPLAAGSFELTVAASGGQQAEARIDLESGQEASTTIYLRR